MSLCPCFYVSLSRFFPISFFSFSFVYSLFSSASYVFFFPTCLISLSLFSCPNLRSTVFLAPHRLPYPVSPPYLPWRPILFFFMKVSSYAFSVISWGKTRKAVEAKRKMMAKCTWISPASSINLDLFSWKTINVRCKDTEITKKIRFPSQGFQCTKFKDNPSF